MCPPAWQSEPMHTLVKRLCDMELGEMLCFSRCRSIVSLNLIPGRLSRNMNQGYNACIHDYWAIIKDTCCDRHHIN